MGGFKPTGCQLLEQELEPWEQELEHLEQELERELERELEQELKQELEPLETLDQEF